MKLENKTELHHPCSGYHPSAEKYSDVIPAIPNTQLLARENRFSSFQKGNHPFAGISVAADVFPQLTLMAKALQEQ
jgi:hypothetical protein